MADETVNPVPALSDQSAPPGFTKYSLPDGRNVFLDKRLSAEQINTAIGNMLDKDYAQKLESGLASHPIAQGVNDTYKQIVEPVNRATGTALAVPGQFALDALRPGDSPEARAGGFRAAQTSGTDIARNYIIPQTPVEAGMLLGTGTAGKLAAESRPLVQRGMRIAGGMAGAGTGSAFDPNASLPGAIATGGAGAATGELLGKTGELARRGITNLTGGLYARDATKIGQAVGDLVPALKGADSPEKLRDLVMSGEGKDLLFQRIMDGYDEVKRLIGNRSLYLPSVQQAMTFDEAKKLLTSKFRTGFKAGQETVTPGTLPSDAARQAKADFFTILQDVRNDLQRLNPGQGGPSPAVATFDEARKDFRVGVNVLDLLYRANGQSNRLFQGRATAAGEKGVDFQTNRLQGFMSANEAKLTRRLGQPEFDAIAREVFRGAEPGTMDTQGVSLGRVFGRQSLPLSGGAILERFPIASIPDYTGKPFTPTAGGQTLLDLLTQHGLSASIR